MRGTWAALVAAAALAHRRGWAAAWLLAVALTFLPSAARAHAAAGMALELREAWLSEPARPEHGERRITLPDPWERTAPARAGVARYRLPLPDAWATQSRPAVFLRRVGNVYRIHLNGHLVREVGRFTPPLPNYNQEPVYVLLPPALLHPRGNELVIEVAGEPRREAGLSSVWVGSASALEPMYERALDLQTRGAWMIASASATMGALGLLVAWRTRQRVYGWFGVANLVWAWRAGALQVRDGQAWAWLLQWGFEFSYSVFVAACGMFLLEMARRLTGRAQAVFAVYVLVSLALSLTHALLNVPQMRTVSLGLTLAVATGMTAYLAWIALRERDRLAALLAASIAVCAAVGARDWVVLRLLHDYNAYTWARYVIVVLMAVMAWRLVDDYARSLRQLHHANRDLTQAVDNKQRELEQAFEAQRAVERRQAATSERDRILREMHDGLGGRLVGAIALAHQLEQRQTGEAMLVKELRQALDDCLVELRLSLDSMDTEPRCLSEALAELRFRVEPSLRAAGVRLVWNLHDDAAEAMLPPGETLQVLRIVREALTNVIKHAHATVVWLSLSRTDDGLELSVLDNGLLQRAAERPRGAPLPSGKRGLANMRHRAQTIGARIEIGPHPEGWAVRLRLPQAVPSR
ncbi:MAG TPA: ATP-binding protein [Burkholderiaceae bacterium]|nr:ATP-binding protein [Burkholderiaceae bacterium]